VIVSRIAADIVRAIARRARNHLQPYFGARNRAYACDPVMRLADRFLPVDAQGRATNLGRPRHQVDAIYDETAKQRKSAISHAERVTAAADNYV
jgi:hypothetical protein